MSLATGKATAASAQRNLALFDFDGTITERDTFLQFVARGARMDTGNA